MKTVCIVTAVIVLCLAFAAYEYYELRLRKAVRVCLKTDLNIKAVLITDLHNSKLHKRDLDLMVREKPDCIFIVGDMLTSAEEDHANALFTINELSKIARIYYSLGNHELRYREYYPDKWKEYVSHLPANCTLLDDRSAKLNDDTEVFGLSLNTDFYKRGRIYSVTEEDRQKNYEIPKGKKLVLLAHDPDHHAFYEEKFNPAVILSGHLHGGVIRLPFVGGIVFSSYGTKHRDKGLYDGKHYVSGGAGEHILPIRFLNRCEIIVLKL